MTLKHLREIINRVPRDQEHLEIEIWLPGSKISLHGEVGKHPDGSLIIEGNLKPGSALEAQ